MVTVNVTPGARTVRTSCRACRGLCGTATTVLAPQGARLATTGDNRGFPLAMWTWVVDSLLKPLPFRQEVRRLSPNSDILVDFGVPKGG